VAKRSPADYLSLAQALLTHPEWIAAAELPGRARQRVRARLIDVSLAQPAAALGSHEGVGGGVHRFTANESTDSLRIPTAGGRFLRECTD
jgi:hypothetical protein